MSAPLFCPECESEYLASATECVDCGIALVPEHELGATAADELPEASELTLVRAASVGWARRLSDLLSGEGIPHRIEAAEGDDEDDDTRRPGATLPYGVYVRAEDLVAALAVDADFMRSQIPDLPDGFEAAEPEGAGGCPACGAEVGADDRECPSCELALVFDEPA